MPVLFDLDQKSSNSVMDNPHFDFFQAQQPMGFQSPLPEDQFVSGGDADGMQQAVLT